MSLLMDHVKDPFKIETEFPGWNPGIKIEIID